MNTAFESVQVETLETVTGGVIQRGPLKLQQPLCRFCKPEFPGSPGPTFPRPTFPGPGPTFPRPTGPDRPLPI